MPVVVQLPPLIVHATEPVGEAPPVRLDVQFVFAP
jgi:hypothetical protein